jgi:hypothetical protein
VIQWRTALDKHHLDGQHLSWHQKERSRIERIQAQSAHPGPDPRAERAVDHIGINQSVAAAKRHFNDGSGEYFHLWFSSERGYEIFVEWLDAIKLQTLGDLASAWEGGSDAVRCWYKRACVPAIEKALKELVAERTREARAAELRRLERAPILLLTDQSQGKQNVIPLADDASIPRRSGTAGESPIRAAEQRDSEVAMKIFPEMAQLVEAASTKVGAELSSIVHTFEDAILAIGSHPYDPAIAAGIKAIMAEQAEMFEAVNEEIRNYPVQPAQEDKFARFEFFSLHPQGLALTQTGLIEVLDQPGEWMRLFQSWRRSRRSPKPKGRRGAPKKPEAEKTRTHWVHIGKPTKLTVEVCDKLAQHSYPDLYAKTKPRSKARKTLRDRVAQQVRPLIKNAAPAGSAT